MAFFNVIVYCEADKLKVKIEQVSSKTEDKQIEPIHTSMKSYREDNFEWTSEKEKYPLFIDNELATTSLEPLDFIAEYRGRPERNYFRKATIYELPTNPCWFINFIRIMHDFLQHNGFDSALKNNKSIDKSLIDGELDKYVDHFFTNIGGFYDEPPLKKLFKIDYKFIHNILALNDIPKSYEQALLVLNQLKEYVFYEYIRNANKNLINDTLCQFAITGFKPLRLCDPDVPEIVPTQSFFKPTNIEKTTSIKQSGEQRLACSIL